MTDMADEQSLLGSSVPDRRLSVQQDLAAEHIGNQRDEAHRQILGRYDSAGGLPQRAPDPTFARYGPAPVSQVRQVFVAKYNPAESTPGVGRFTESDPYRVPQLWDHAAPPECWVSDMPGHNRWTPAHARIDAGDLIFVFRSEPKLDGKALPDPSPLRGQRYLLGVWWVTRVHRLYIGRPRNRSVTEAWHVPLVRFDNPVHVRTIRRHPALRDLAAFTDRQRSVLVQASPSEAAALAAACSLPSWVLADSDPVDMARRLARIRTGARPGDLAYRASAAARYAYIHAIEAAASLRVQRDLETASWSVVSKERVPGWWGADLDCRRQLPRQVEEHRAVEVKGKGGRSLTSVVLQASQYREALASAAAGDDEWWLVMCPEALDEPPPPYVERSAMWVRDNWDPKRIR